MILITYKIDVHATREDRGGRYCSSRAKNPARSHTAGSLCCQAGDQG
jgi:hypothetical protein